MSYTYIYTYTHTYTYTHVVLGVRLHEDVELQRLGLGQQVAAHVELDELQPHICVYMYIYIYI